MTNEMMGEVNFTDDFPTCTSNYCYDFIVWCDNLITDFNQLCQQHARDDGDYSWQNYYYCDSVADPGGGYDIYCCMYGG